MKLSRRPRRSLSAAMLIAPAILAGYSTTAAADNPAEYTIYSFSSLSNNTNAEGATPIGGLTLGADGTVYGVTFNGGANGGGTVYKFSNGAATALHSFGPYVGNTDGAGATQLVTGNDGNLYGATYQGGATGNGTIFRVTPDGSFTLLHTFSADTGTNQSGSGENVDGVDPFGRMVEGADGNFYGTAEFGGATGNGTIYKITPDGTFTVLYTFTGGSDGGQPFAGLAKGDDGNFYGTTRVSSSTGGTFFKITPSGTLTTLYTFTGDGESLATLAKGADGNFYGRTQPRTAASTSGNTIFRITPSGDYTLLHTSDPPTYMIFNDLTQKVGPNVEGRGVVSALVAAPDGSFYGAAGGGGAGNSGTLFRVTPQGDFTNLHSFSNKLDAKEHRHALSPSTDLLLDADGNLVGASQGGGNGEGAIFKLVLDSPLTTNLTITPSSIPTGQTATAAWTSTGASNCHFINGGLSFLGTPRATSGSIQVAAPFGKVGRKVVTAMQCADSSGGLSNSTASLTKAAP